MRLLFIIVLVVSSVRPMLSQTPSCRSITNQKTGLKATLHPQYGCADEYCLGPCSLKITDPSGKVLNANSGENRPFWNRPLEWLDNTHLLLQVSNIGQWSNASGVALISFDPWTDKTKTLFFVDCTCQVYGCYKDRRGFIAVIAGKTYYFERSLEKALSIYKINSQDDLKQLSDSFLVLQTESKFPEFALVPNHLKLIIDVKGKLLQLDEQHKTFNP